MSNENQITINKDHPAVHELHSALARSVDTTLDDTKKWAALESAAAKLLAYIETPPLADGSPVVLLDGDSALPRGEVVRIVREREQRAITPEQAAVPLRVAIRIGGNESIALPVVDGCIEITAEDIAALTTSAAVAGDDLRSKVRDISLRLRDHEWADDPGETDRDVLELREQINELIGRVNEALADLKAKPASGSSGERYTVDAVAWEGFIADWNRYVAGDPKMPFVQIREGLVAVIDSAVPG